MAGCFPSPLQLFFLFWGVIWAAHRSANVNVEDADNLIRLENKLALIRDRVRSVVLRYNTGFYLYGPGGSGKTFAVRGELESLGTRWMLHNSSMTAAGLFDMLHDLPDHTHLFEDMEPLYRDRQAVGYLRSATWGDSNMQNRIVTRTINKRRKEFTFTGGVIILSNLPIGEIATLKALGTRLNPAEFNLSDGEKRALMWKIAETGKFGLSPETCEEVCEYIVYYSQSMGNHSLDLRLLDNAFGDRLMYDRGECQTHWKDLVASRIDSQIIEPRITPRTRQARLFDERDVAKQVWDMFPDTHQRAERAQEWKKRTNGKSERALYRRSAELGFAPYPKYVSFQDFDDFAEEEGQADESVNLSN